MAGKNNDSFKSGDLVFAKMKGFPHWPARICKAEDGYRKRVPVYFFGTHQIGYVTPENVVPYAGNKLKYGSGVRIRGFTEGMWEIQNTPGLGSKLKVPGKTNTNTTPAKTSAPEATPSKLVSPTKTSHDKLKDGSSPSRSEPDGKPAAARHTPCKVSGEKDTAVRTTTRSSARLAPDKSTESGQIRETEEHAAATRSRRSAIGGLSADGRTSEKTPAEVKMETRSNTVSAAETAPDKKTASGNETESSDEAAVTTSASKAAGVPAASSSTDSREVAGRVSTRSRRTDSKLNNIPAVTTTGKRRKEEEEEEIREVKRKKELEVEKEVQKKTKGISEVKEEETTEGKTSESRGSKRKKRGRKE